MIFGDNREAIRQAYRDAWQKAAAEEVLSPLEAQIAAVIEEHPEFLAAIQDGGHIDDQSLSENPFLHMGLHLTIRDQVKLDHPLGIRTIFEQLRASCGDAHAAEHQMFDALAETLWDAQQQRAEPDVELYMERLRRLN